MSEHDSHPDPLLAGMRDRLAAERGVRARLRALPTPVRAGLGIGMLAILAAAVGFGARRSDLGVYPFALLVVSVAALAGFAVYAALLALRPVQEKPVGPARMLAMLAAGLAITTVLALPQAHEHMHAHPESFAGVGADFLPRAIGCFLYGLITALPFVLLLFALDRRDRRPWPDVALFAAAGGLAGNLTLLLHCPLVAPAHLLAGHVPVTLGFLLLLLAAAGVRRGKSRRV